MDMLLKRGGDLRLHDCRNRGYREYVKLNTNILSRTRVLSRLERKKKKLQKLFGENAEELPLARPKRSKTSLTNMLSRKFSKDDITTAPSVITVGFGKIYCEGRFQRGMVGIIDIIQLGEIVHPSTPNVSFKYLEYATVESALWGTVMASLKKNKDGTVHDLLIKEYEYMAKLRHPSIILLMGIIPVNDFESVMLLYENISTSLFVTLYEKKKKYSDKEAVQIMNEISAAVLFLHQKELLHCSISSHAILFTATGQSKLGNFEYMVKSYYAKELKDQSDILKQRHINTVLYWIAPEALKDHLLSKSSDVYSLCAVLWELINGKLPWDTMTSGTLRKEFYQKKNTLEIKEDVSPPLKTILKDGLSLEASERPNTKSLLDSLIAVKGPKERRQRANSRIRSSAWI
ncbi:hypothetical protein LSH36_110g04044 [Paralvinella palmiformis]|uniref:Protein kinase domain-containing protein n=1 Tax=Paralvinella palmiformis TaxID=53620 RepID=A0AAD9JYV9_9ANNE|nr:hypothetical protein LSH36_110g04044 [Paralvinella palmiformis]